MHVFVTAGHVDHGKSTLIQALTGINPDRLAEEHRRGMTIDLGFAWTCIHNEQFAFVDVPGHERFISNMLTGIGPASAVLFVVAADEGWMPQSTEHLAAFHALDMRHAVLAVTKTDRADPQPVLSQALEHLRSTSLGEVPAVAVSAQTGAGLDDLRDALVYVATRQSRPDPHSPVRLWIDRCFTIRGAGTIVTGTLNVGTIRVGDRLQLSRAAQQVVIRGVHVLGAPVETVSGVARVALNLRGVSHEKIHRGDALYTPGTTQIAQIVDVRIRSASPESLSGEVMVHVGATAVAARLRPLGPHHARLSTREPLPWRMGDRMILRRGRQIIGGAIVLDLTPPELARRGDAIRHGIDLSARPEIPDSATELRRRGIVRITDFRATGMPPPANSVAIGAWLTDRGHIQTLHERLAAFVHHHEQHSDIAPTLSDAMRALELEDPELIATLIRPPLTLTAGVLSSDGNNLASITRRKLANLDSESTAFETWNTADLAHHGLRTQELRHAEQLGHIIRIGNGTFTLPQSVKRAVTALAVLPQPFTASQARQTLGTTRKTVIVLLEYLDTQGVTIPGQNRARLLERQAYDDER